MTLKAHIPIFISTYVTRKSLLHILKMTTNCDIMYVCMYLRSNKMCRQNLTDSQDRLILGKQNETKRADEPTC
jgi:hypothetical protein